jgi:hypothetical protein
MDFHSTRALVKSTDGEQHTFIGCNYYRIETRCFGLVVRVIGFNGVNEEVSGVFYKPISATVGAMEPGQVDMVRKRRLELEAELR